MPTRRRMTSYLIFIALTVPFGIVVHLVAELASLGWRSDAELVFSGKHWYLAALAAISWASVLGFSHAVSGADRRRIAACLASDLPLGGSGFRFWALCFWAQFAFFWITQLSEGEPLGAGDLRMGIVAAVLASAMGALVLSLCKSEILSIVLEAFSFIDAQEHHALTSSALLSLDIRVRIRREHAFIRAFSPRPPPCLAWVITHSSFTRMQETSPCTRLRGFVMQDVSILPSRF